MLIGVSTEEDVAKRVYAHLQVRDYATACEEARQGFAAHPNSPILFEAYIKAFAKAGEEKEVWAVWNQHADYFPDLATKRDLLECMAWGTIENGARSSSPIIRVMALLGAFFGQDAKGVDIMCRNMRDPNASLRAIAVKLAGHMRDAKLQDEVLRLFKFEKNWNVRMEAIEAAGKMEIQDAKPLLMEILADDDSRAEEKAFAIEALLHMLDDMQRGEVIRLAQSPRAGLRLLACEVVTYLELMRDADQIIALLNDHQADVRATALLTLGRLRVTHIDDQPVSVALLQRLSDRDPKVAITAAWLLTINDPEQGQKCFESWLSHADRDVRLQAAAALASTGKYGVPLMRRAFQSTQDTYVKMNLAIGLISQRTDTGKACEALFQGLTQQHERWMWDERSGFRVLAPSKVKYDDVIPNNPETVNQITRLEVLNILAIMKYPKAQEAVRQFLKEKIWGVTGMASAMLLTEGDEDALDIVQSLLQDPDKKVRTQAALILALWGRGEEAINVLKSAYKDADREMKERILESLGRVGTPSIIPFLTDKLQEPYQSLRIIAAAALLECLYH